MNCIMCNDKTITCLQLIVLSYNDQGLNENTLKELCDVHLDIFHEQFQYTMTAKTGCCANKEKHIICCIEQCISCKDGNHNRCKLEECRCGFNEIRNREKYISKEIQESIKDNHHKRIIIKKELKN